MAIQSAKFFTMKKFKLFFALAFCVLVAFESLAQDRVRVRGKRGKAKRVVVVKRSVYRPARVTVFKPAWHPRWTCHRRWVYFPKHNLYWDNWRNHYVFYNTNVWVSQSNPPTTLGTVNLAEEKYVELAEAEDDVDDIGSRNATHKETHKES